MLSGIPDRTLGLARLEKAIQDYRSEVATKTDWFFSERYIDRGILDPYYILQFKDHVDDEGDDLYDQKLFFTPYSYLRGVNMTREKHGAGQSYWRKINPEALDQRLENFITMYREDYLQPPGAKGDLYNPQYRHKQFKEKRFLFEIRSLTKGIIGVGPKLYAGVVDTGAVCGQVTDKSGVPLDGVEIQLLDKRGAWTRTTISGGLFWFSKVPEGEYTLRVKDQSCLIQVLRQEEFGNVKGWVTDENSWPVNGAELKIKAPDGEIFPAWSNPSGRFSTGPLPAYPIEDSPLSNFPYMLSIPGFMFSVQKTVYVKDAVISGFLYDSKGLVLENSLVMLYRDYLKVAETRTDEKGCFRFFGLAGGRYQIEVPGTKIYLSNSLSGRVKGELQESPVTTTRICLIAEGDEVMTERLDPARQFDFEDVAPGRYVLRIKK